MKEETLCNSNDVNDTNDSTGLNSSSELNNANIRDPQKTTNCMKHAMVTSSHYKNTCNNNNINNNNNNNINIINNIINNNNNSNNKNIHNDSSNDKNINNDNSNNSKQNNSKKHNKRKDSRSEEAEKKVSEQNSYKEKIVEHIRNENESSDEFPDTEKEVPKTEVLKKEVVAFCESECDTLKKKESSDKEVPNSTKKIVNTKDPSINYNNNTTNETIDSWKTKISKALIGLIGRTVQDKKKKKTEETNIVPQKKETCINNNNKKKNNNNNNNSKQELYLQKRKTHPSRNKKIPFFLKKGFMVDFHDANYYNIYIDKCDNNFTFRKSITYVNRFNENCYTVNSFPRCRNKIQNDNLKSLFNGGMSFSLKRKRNRNVHRCFKFGKNEKLKHIHIHRHRHRHRHRQKQKHKQKYKQKYKQKHKYKHKHKHKHKNAERIWHEKTNNKIKREIEENKEFPITLKKKETHKGKIKGKEIVEMRATATATTTTTTSTEKDKNKNKEKEKEKEKDKSETKEKKEKKGNDKLLVRSVKKYRKGTKFEQINKRIEKNKLHMIKEENHNSDCDKKTKKRYGECERRSRSSSCSSVIYNAPEFPKLWGASKSFDENMLKKTGERKTTKVKDIRKFKVRLKPYGRKLCLQVNLKDLKKTNDLFEKEDENKIDSLNNMDSTTRKIDADTASSICSNVFENRVFVTGYSFVTDEKNIKAKEITHIINAAGHECINQFEDNFIYKTYYLKDDIYDDIFYTLLDSFYFIQSALKENKDNKILLHCNKGISRSITIAIFFLMNQLNLNYFEAFQVIKNARQMSNPNMNYITQLMRLFQMKESLTKYNSIVHQVETKENKVVQAVHETERGNNENKGSTTKTKQGNKEGFYIMTEKEYELDEKITIIQTENRHGEKTLVKEMKEEAMKNKEEYNIKKKTKKLKEGSMLLFEKEKDIFSPSINNIGKEESETCNHFANALPINKQELEPEQKNDHYRLNIKHDKEHNMHTLFRICMEKDALIPLPVEINSYNNTILIDKRFNYIYTPNFSEYYLIMFDNAYENIYNSIFNNFVLVCNNFFGVLNKKITIGDSDAADLFACWKIPADMKNSMPDLNEDFVHLQNYLKREKETRISTSASGKNTAEKTHYVPHIIT